MILSRRRRASLTVTFTEARKLRFFQKNQNVKNSCFTRLPVHIHEQCFETRKKSYYFKCHKGMVGNLLRRKEKWASCKDPEREIVHKIWSFMFWMFSFYRNC
ncbi:hypothetical protein LOK49_LG01G01455 [Camellia lanceoleosa]|uniref:Uncharacterized protein n=1 Tax=Camellia lanceoleosa TaxID=1840588 RepID=A0ACC0IUY8_9ERIC|nr:hypothetical protein LOK49_LG01G01455 [Camellia lanceoleosa]